MTTPNVVTEEMVEAAAREIGEMRIQSDWRFVPSDDVARVALGAALPFFPAAPASAPGGEPKRAKATAAQAVLGV